MNILIIWGKMVVIQINICAWTVIIEWVQTRLVFVLWLNMILGFQFHALTWPRTQTFNILLENESRVGTPLRWNLFTTTFETLLLLCWCKSGRLFWIWLCLIWQITNPTESQFDTLDSNLERIYFKVKIFYIKEITYYSGVNL